ncbi:MAG: hypothetical protein A3F40_03080 [Chlamydiae bacterium RIFCSPHIGHO2_12_FULL_27_8]|nr:MAG: hypothetical protein A3F40_03080 [Chlamydiae bacterium RIFCSPHIGHO2_12_FULL_27_8]
MAQNKKKIDFDILYSYFMSIFSFLYLFFLINIKILYFVPLIVSLFYKKNIKFLLFLSLGIGFLQDSFSSITFVFAFSYIFTTLSLYFLKRILKENILNLTIFTYIYSVVFSILNPLFYSVFETPIKITLKWIFSDIFIMPIIDAFYSLVFFYLSVVLFSQIRRLNIRKLWIIYKKIIFQKLPFLRLK